MYVEDHVSLIVVEETVHTALVIIEVGRAVVILKFMNPSLLSLPGAAGVTWELMNNVRCGKCPCRKSA
jgi:hypothetical protein